MRSRFYAHFATAILCLTFGFAAVAQNGGQSGGVGPVPARLPDPANNSQQTIAQKIADSKNRMDINTATAAQLKTLPGIGDNYASRIIAGRPYTAKNQLVQRGILPQNVYAGITDRIVAHRPKK